MAAGPILAIAEVVRVEFHGPASHADILKTLARYSEQLQLDDSFLSSIEGGRYATLVHLGAVARVGPRRVAKSDMRGWVVLSGSEQAGARLR